MYAEMNDANVFLFCLQQRSRELTGGGPCGPAMQWVSRLNVVVLTQEPRCEEEVYGVVCWHHRLLSL